MCLVERLKDQTKQLLDLVQWFVVIRERDLSLENWNFVVGFGRTF